MDENSSVDSQRTEDEGIRNTNDGNETEEIRESESFVSEEDVIESSSFVEPSQRLGNEQ